MVPENRRRRRSRPVDGWPTVRMDAGRSPRAARCALRAARCATFVNGENRNDRRDCTRNSNKSPNQFIINGLDIQKNNRCSSRPDLFAFIARSAANPLV
ncbi:hypothetical protein [Burkholderia territorii]|uniref:hypothetical protein n=1 Tax=Burkholderia territorii TaxID=1503055 RepID=UPI000ADF6ADA|nr:hypothetical protein [Burkholderia territorii]